MRTEGSPERAPLMPSAVVAPLAHSPPLPTIAVGRRAYSPTWKAHGLVTFLGTNYAHMRLDRNPSATISVLSTELVPVE